MAEGVVVDGSSAVINCRDQLRKIREASVAGECSANADDEVLGVLEKLRCVQVTMAMLRETAIGVEINNSFFRKHTNIAVQEKSKALIHTWRSAAAGEQNAEGSSPVNRSVSETSKPTDTNQSIENKKTQRELESSNHDTKEKIEKKEKKNKKERNIGDEPEAKKVKPSCANEANEALAKCFDELSSFEFKKKQKFKGIAYKKAAATLRLYEDKITSGAEVSVLPNIGKESVKKINEFLETGSIERLEKYRRGEME